MSRLTEPIGEERRQRSPGSLEIEGREDREPRSRPVPVRPREWPLPFLFLGRSVRIVVLTLAFFVAVAVGRVVSPSSGPRLLRWYLQAAGAAFVKLGQVLAMRYDLLSARYCQELSRLLDALPPIPYDAVAGVVESDLGRPLRECYRDFDSQALASASIAQVHGATLWTGEAVVVKVIRPGTARRFRVDFAYMRLGARLLDRWGPVGDLNVRRLVGELIQLTKEELDFRREARNIYQMHEAMLSDGLDHYSPVLVPELCGRRVLTMERIDGVRVTDMIAALEAGDEELLATWAELGVEPQRTAVLLMRSILEQSMRHRLFHADPHAGNLIVMPGGTLGWIDFGMLGWLDERLWRAQFRMREAVVEGRIYAAYQELLTTLEPLPPIDLTAFESEVTDIFHEWTVASSAPTASLLEKSSGFAFLRILDAVRRAGLQLPTSLVRLYRAIFVGDIVMLKLDPTIDWVPIMRRFVTGEEWRQLEARVARGFSPGTLGAAVEAYSEAPRTLAALTEWVQTGLPGVRREYAEQRDRLERVAELLLRYVRAGVGLAVLGVLGARFVAPALFPQTAWDKLGNSLDSSWLPVLAFGALLWILLGRLTREFSRNR
jgi:ubiquinone biosynthesis protein